VLPTSTEIEYFAEIYQTRHLSKAAIRLGLTQPTLSLSLQKLEEKLAAKLFHRTKQGVIPTEEGIFLYRKTNALLDCWGEVQKGIYRSTTEIVGRFKVGCHPSVGAYVLPVFLDRLHAQAPGIEVELSHDVSRKITEGVVSHAIEVGFVVNPVRHPDLVLKKLGDDRVRFWKKRGAGPLPKRIFADVNLVQMQDILGKTHAKEFRDWKLVSTPSLELIRTLTLSGQGIGILPERVAKADGADLVPYDSSLPTYDDKIFLAYRKDVLASKAGRECVRLASFEL
jgi:DNA-binding transcriptional LysR family regulator